MNKTITPTGRLSVQIKPRPLTKEDAALIEARQKENTDMKVTLPKQTNLKRKAEDSPQPSGLKVSLKRPKISPSISQEAEPTAIKEPTILRVYLEHAPSYTWEFTKYFLVKIVDCNLVDGLLTGTVKHAICIQSDPENLTTIKKSQTLYGSDERLKSIDQRLIDDVREEGYALVKHSANLQTLFQTAQYNNTYTENKCRLVAEL